MAQVELFNAASTSSESDIGSAKAPRQGSIAHFALFHPLPPNHLTTMSAKAARSSMGLFKLWTTDSGTFPVVIICSFAAVAAGASASRYLLHNPDVCFDKSKRNSSMHYQSDDGADWRARRFRFANLHRNAINQSRQFDPAFAKDENKSVTR